MALAERNLLLGGEPGAGGAAPDANPFPGLECVSQAAIDHGAEFAISQGAALSVTAGTIPTGIAGNTLRWSSPPPLTYWPDRGRAGVRARRLHKSRSVRSSPRLV